MRLKMPESPRKSVPNHPVSISDSDEVALHHPNSRNSPSQEDHKHRLSSPPSPLPKRVRTLNNRSPKQPDRSPDSPIPIQSSTSAQNLQNPNPQTQSPKSQPPAVKSQDITSPPARHGSPGTPSKNTDTQPATRDQDSDEDEPPLDLAKISSYEYEQVAKLNPLQLRRYEQYRRSDLKNAKVRRLISAISPTSKPNDPYIIAVKGLAKLFVGDIVEEALQVKKRLGDKGALQPKHIREAYRRLRREGAVSYGNQSDPSL